MRQVIFCTALMLILILPCAVSGRSAFSPRHSGLEPPGGPRQLEAVPGNSPGRTPEGGMGYTDAYGNTLTDKIPEKKKTGHRLRPGAYGNRQSAAEPLPDLPASAGRPVWNFQ